MTASDAYAIVRAGSLLASGLGAVREDSGPRFPAWSEDHTSLAHFVAEQQREIERLQAELATAPVPVQASGVPLDKVVALRDYWKEHEEKHPAIKMFVGHLNTLLSD